MDMSLDLSKFKKSITSQSNEDGIIEKIFETIGTRNKVCVEFGGYDLKEFSNVFTLWSSKGWSALIIEGSKKRYNKMINDYQQFVADTGIDSVRIENKHVMLDGNNSLEKILRKYDILEEFDLLSMDVDGIDYHIWKQLAGYRPRVVIIEINTSIPPHISLIGRERGNYIGTGIKDMCELGNNKGYDLVACTITNAVFVIHEEAEKFTNRNDLDKLLPKDNITYAMSAFDGEVIFSQQPSFRVFHGINYFSKEHLNIEKGDFWKPNFRNEFIFPIVKILKNNFPTIFYFLKRKWASHSFSSEK